MVKRKEVGLSAGERRALYRASYWQARKDGERVKRAMALAKEAVRSYEAMLNAQVSPLWL